MCHTVGYWLPVVRYHNATSTLIPTDISTDISSATTPKPKIELAVRHCIFSLLYKFSYQCWCCCLNCCSLRSWNQLMINKMHHISVAFDDWDGIYIPFAETHIFVAKCKSAHHDVAWNMNGLFFYVQQTIILTFSHNESGWWLKASKRTKEVTKVLFFFLLKIMHFFFNLEGTSYQDSEFWGWHSLKNKIKNAFEEILKCES